MPITESAKKAMRQARRRTETNRVKKDALKQAVKVYRTLVASNKTDEAKTQLAKVYKLADKTAKGNTIAKNKARRIKSRLAKLLK